MTLEEAIKHCEEVADKYDTELNLINCGISNESCDNCIECASEHRQLAEWLRLLKEITESGDCNTCIYRDCVVKPKLGQLVRYNCYSYMKREVKANERMA